MNHKKAVTFAGVRCALHYLLIFKFFFSKRNFIKKLNK